MNYSSARTGRVFVIRLEDGDILHTSVEEVARREGVRCGVCWFVGGADQQSTIVVGPVDGQARPVQPMTLSLPDVHEAAAVGTIFPNATGEPILHMHAVFGRGAEVRAGCVRAGVRTWVIGEVVILELLDCQASRQRDADTGFELLQAQPPAAATRA